VRAFISPGTLPETVIENMRVTITNIYTQNFPQRPRKMIVVVPVFVLPQSTESYSIFIL
jgi:hypothetical protein